MLQKIKARCRDANAVSNTSSVEIDITKKTHGGINVLGLPSFSGEGSPHWGLLACAYARITAKLYFLLSQPSQNCVYVGGR